MKEIARYIYIIFSLSPPPFFQRRSSRVSLFYTFPACSQSSHGNNFPYETIYTLSILYPIPKKKKKKRKRKKNSRNEISEAEINFRITAEFETRSADHKCARDARKKIVNVFHHPSSSHAWFLRLDRARMLGHTRTTGRERERKRDIPLSPPP